MPISQGEKIQIRQANKSDLQELLHVLNEATLHLLQKEIHQWEYPWDEEKISTQLYNHGTYVLLEEKKIIGTFYITEINRINDLSVEQNSKYLSQIAILPAYQGRNYGSYIIEFACSLVGELNKAMYLDCWAGNKKLKAFYGRKLEYVGDYPEEDYFISIFRYPRSSTSNITKQS